MNVKELLTKIKPYLIGALIGIVITTGIAFYILTVFTGQSAGRIAELENRLATAQGLVSESEVTIADINKQLSSARQGISIATGRADRAEREIKSIRTELADSRKQLESITDRFNRLTAIIKQGAIAIKQLEELNGQIESIIDRMSNTIGIIESLLKELGITT